MSMTPEERSFVARAAMLNTESEAYVAAFNERVEAFMLDCPPERLHQLAVDHPGECAAIREATPDIMALSTLDALIREVGRFTDLPSEDRGYVGIAFMALHEARAQLLDGQYVSAWHSSLDAATRLHWVARERKRNPVRSSHRMPDTHRLDQLDRVSQRITTWGGGLHQPAKVVG